MKPKLIPFYDTREKLIGKLDFDSLEADRENGRELGNGFIPQVGKLYQQDCVVDELSVTVTYRVPTNYPVDELDNVDWRSKALSATLRQGV